VVGEVGLDLFSPEFVPLAEFYEHDNESSSSIKCREFLGCLNSQSFASEGLCSSELVVSWLFGWLVG
jgi:hypothetical protein